MKEKGWKIINAVEAAVKGFPDPRSNPPMRILTPDDIENERERQLLAEYDREKRVPAAPKPLVSFGDIFQRAINNRK